MRFKASGCKWDFQLTGDMNINEKLVLVRTSFCAFYIMLKILLRPLVLASECFSSFQKYCSWKTATEQKKKKTTMYSENLEKDYE